MRLLALASVVAVWATPALGAAQSPQPSTAVAAPATVTIPDHVVQSRARQSLDRAEAYVAMARQAPAAATDPANAHRAVLLAREAAVAYRLASADYAAGGYHAVIVGARRSIEVAQQAIASALAAGPVVVSEAGGDVSIDASTAAPPDSTPPPRMRYHGPSPDAPARPANWRVIGPIPFGAEPPHEIQPNAPPVQLSRPYGTTSPFGVVSPAQSQAAPPTG